MPTRTPQLPKYRHYKPKDLAVVRIDGKDHYLGKFGSEASKEKYRRLIAELVATPTSALPLPACSDAAAALAINDLIVAYWDHSNNRSAACLGPEQKAEGLPGATKTLRLPLRLSVQCRQGSLG
jgi:hypothetical protein